MVSKKYAQKLLDEIPSMMEESLILYTISKSKIDCKFIQTLKDISGFTDDDMARWLNISVRTYRDYKKPGSVIKENVKEGFVLLFSLVKHGIAVFGSAEQFYQWLNTENFYFDNTKPAEKLNTYTGMHFVDDALTHIEYGDNC